jgi:hypothetical protein
VSARLDRVLDVLDVGLQRATTGHGGEPVAADLCVRCQTHEPVENASWCEPCQRPPITVEQLRDLVDALTVWAKTVGDTLGPALAKAVAAIAVVGHTVNLDPPERASVDPDDPYPSGSL